MAGLLLAIGAAATVYRAIVWMPGRSHGGPLPPLSPSQADAARLLMRDVEVLGGSIGERHTARYDALVAAERHVEARLREMGHSPSRQEFDAGGRACVNVEVELPGAARASEIVVVGAHYDSAPGAPGANDNATGTAALLALAQRLTDLRSARTLRLVFFTNEEPPHFTNGTMGSIRYARRCRERHEDVVAMLSLETLGYYSDAPGSQLYPFPFSMLYPDRGCFVGFVGNLASRRLVHRCIATFRGAVPFPSEGVAAPEAIEGVGWSDHASFWAEGYPGVMVTDTAVFRDPHYHTAQDTPGHVDGERLARVVDGIEAVVRDLVM